jgi:hypothetical protein
MRSRSRSFLLIAGIFLQSSCTAWQYDIEGCDPNKGAADCMRLNDRDGISLSILPSDPCKEIWQCDRSTATCKKSVQDLDGDGDPPPSCGGNDCDDRNSSYSGLNGTCSCAALQDKPCTNQAVGHCKASGTWMCDGVNVPTCSAPLISRGSWALTKDAINDTWDWNCDGRIEENCTSLSDLSGPVLPCVKTMCSDSLLSEIQTESSKAAPNVDGLCEKYCRSRAVDVGFGFMRCPQEVKTKLIFNCFGSGNFPANPDEECGKLVVQCKCRDDGWANSCVRESAKELRVFCQ